MKRLLLLISLMVGTCLVAPAQKTKPKAKAAATSTTSATKKKQPTQREKLQAEQKRKQQEIALKKKRLAEIETRVKRGLQDVMVLNNEIDDKRRTIDTIRQSIAALDTTIAVLDSQLVVLNKELDERRQRYVRSVRYMHRNRKIQNRLMFIFCADNFNQMYRRTRFVDQYATYQKAQGEAVKSKQEQVSQKQQELQTSRNEKAALLSRGQQEQQKLVMQQQDQQRMVDALKKEQKTTQALLAQQQKEEADLNARIERMIADEMAREKARLEAERKKKAEAEAARKKQQEKARQERERRLAAAKEAERKAKAEAKAAKTQQEKNAAQQRARQAEQQRKQAEREEAQAKKEERKAEKYSEPAADKKLSGSFASNKGRLPVPITGPYKIVRGFGSYVPDGLSAIRLDSKGIHLKGQSGAMVRCIFDGEVSRIFAKGDRYIVMVRHGRYISVYCNLTSVSVGSGQKVKAYQTLGALGSDCTLQFQLRNWTELLNPRSWLAR